LRLAQFLYYKRNTHVNIHPKDINRSILLKLKKEIQEDDELREELTDQDYIEFLKKKKNLYKDITKNKKGDKK